MEDSLKKTAKKSASSKAQEKVVRGLVQESLAGNEGAAGCVRVCIDTCREAPIDVESMVRDLVQENFSGGNGNPGCVRVCMDTCRESAEDEARPRKIRGTPEDWFRWAKVLDRLADFARAGGARDLYQSLRSVATAATIHGERLNGLPSGSRKQASRD
jgi:hypothetical protein